MTFLLPTLGVAAVALLARSGILHLAAPAALHQVLERQARLPSPLRTLVARALGPTEIVVGGAVAAALATDRAELVTGAGVAAVILGLCFLATMALVLGRRPAAPCGCGAPDDRPAHPAALARSVLVLAGGLALLAGAAQELAALAAGETTTVVLAGVAVALAADGVADALSAPGPLPDGGTRP